MPAEYQPNYQHIATDVERKIRSGEWPPGTQLPTKREIAVMYGTSIRSVEDAMILLRERALVAGRQGKGVYVAVVIPPASPGAATS